MTKENYRPIPSTKLLDATRSHPNDSDYARWVQRMVNAGWRYWLGISAPEAAFVDELILWRHADEYEAKIGAIDSHRYFLHNEIPDPYKVIENNK